MNEVVQHSRVVGGSTAKRVISCPGSVALCAAMPPKPSSKYADEGTLVHNVMDLILTTGQTPESFAGMEYEGIKLTQELIDEKVYPALRALDEIDPNKEMEYATETKVGFGSFLPGVFGSTDLLGRIGRRAFILDWKFGSGVAVDAADNPQLMFYAAAAMRTPEVAWVFEECDEVECIIVLRARLLLQLCVEVLLSNDFHFGFATADWLTRRNMNSSLMVITDCYFDLGSLREVARQIFDLAVTKNRWRSV